MSKPDKKAEDVEKGRPEEEEINLNTKMTPVTDFSLSLEDFDNMAVMPTSDDSDSEKKISLIDGAPKQRKKSKQNVIEDSGKISEAFTKESQDRLPPPPNRRKKAVLITPLSGRKKKKEPKRSSITKQELADATAQLAASAKNFFSVLLDSMKDKETCEELGRTFSQILKEDL